MADDVLHFERLEVRRAPGIPSPGLKVDDLSPGINVICGPNASGKTTLARAISTLLWPGEPALDDAELAGEFLERRQRWVVTFHRGRYGRRRDGRDTDEEPDLPPAKNRDRYTLGLAELLAAEGNNFARIIARESAGGYDVESAREALDFKEPSLRRGKSTRAVVAAEKSWNTAKREQEKIHAEKRVLEDKRRALEQVRNDKLRSEAVELALQFKRTEQDTKSADERLGEFSDSMEKVRGDELEIVQRQRERLEQAQRDLEDVGAEIDDLENALATSRISDEGLPEDTSSGLEEYASRLAELDRNRRDIAADCEALRARRDETRADFASAVQSDPDLFEIDAATVDRIGLLSRKIEEQQGVRKAYDVVEDLLGDRRADREEIDVLRNGIDRLLGWLRTPAENEEDKPESAPDKQRGRKARWISAGGAFGALILAILLVAMGHFGWALAVAILVILFVVIAWMLIKEPGEKADDRAAEVGREYFASEFRALGIEQPEQWSEDSVRKRLDAVVRQWTEAVVDEEMARRWETYRSDHLEVRQKADRGHREFEELLASIGLDRNVSDGYAPATHLLVQKIAQWQSMKAKVAAEQARLEEVESEIDEILAEVGTRLEAFGFDEPKDATQAVADVDVLIKAAEQFERDREALREARSQKEREARRAEEARQELERIFTNLEVDYGDEAAVAALCDRLDDYRNAREKLTGLRSTLDDRRRRLESHQAYDSQLLDADIDALQVELDELRKSADRYEDLSREIAEIETRIEDAKRSTQVEEKWAAYREELESLRRERRRDFRKMIGSELANFVGEQTRDQGRPEVFKRARELFSTITSGSYRLLLEDREGRPVFRAFDESKGIDFALGELSSGTRVQLLLAVRIAFVEQQERGISVPLVFDETLANSDDRRAQAIIDATLRLAEAGRQVFYFTAQSDEVRKWNSRLADTSVASNIIELSREGRGIGDGEKFGAEVGPPVVAEVPEYRGRSHAEFGAELKVDDGLNPWIELGSIHLWYVVEDVGELHTLLSAGIRSWGQLRNMAEHNGLSALGLEDEDYDRINARMGALKALAEARAIGRGRPVDRRILEESGAVSENFIDRVSELCEDFDGDAERLLAAIDDGQVKRFRKDKAEELRDFLQREGYFDPADTLSAEEIWSRVLAACSSAIEGGFLTPTELRRLIERAVGDGGASKRQGGPQVVAP